ncbi:MAG: hypothetical protein P4L41_01365 [Flavipsychrobacter sp.]|nr:hypothetical protein [Flavipsychrobacter sp.]
MKKFIYTLVISILFFSCQKSTPALTPARQLAGTWTTPNPITFYYSSDGCGSYNRYSSFTMKVNWQITTLGDNSVNITETLVSASTQTSIGSNCGLPAPTLTFPMQFVAVITGSKFALDEQQMQYSSTGAALGLANVRIGIFNYTSNNITGYVNEVDCPAYCSGYSTDSNTFILTKVN